MMKQNLLLSCHAEFWESKFYSQEKVDISAANKKIASRSYYRQMSSYSGEKFMTKAIGPNMYNSVLKIDRLYCGSAIKCMRTTRRRLLFHLPPSSPKGSKPTYLATIGKNVLCFSVMGQEITVGIHCLWLVRRSSGFELKVKLLRRFALKFTEGRPT